MYSSKYLIYFHVTGVIVFGSDQEVAELMKAVKRRNATGQFFWIGSDGWAARALVYEGESMILTCSIPFLYFSFLADFGIKFIISKYDFILHLMFRSYAL